MREQASKQADLVISMNCLTVIKVENEEEGLSCRFETATGNN
jgi:hypothetical protein